MFAKLLVLGALVFGTPTAPGYTSEVCMNTFSAHPHAISYLMYVGRQSNDYDRAVSVTPGYTAITCEDLGIIRLDTTETYYIRAVAINQFDMELWAYGEIRLNIGPQPPVPNPPTMFQLAMGWLMNSFYV